jgi:WD40 repeat protein
LKLLTTLLSILIAFIYGAGASYGQQLSSGLPGISLLWSKSVGGVQAISLSQKATRLAIATVEGKVAVWAAQDGIPIWATANQTCNSIQVSDGPGFVLEYTQLALDSRQIVLRKGETGAVAWKDTFFGAVWCAAFNQTGNWLAVGTGDGVVHLFDLLHGGTEQNITLAGTPTSVQFDPITDRLYVGHWDKSGVSCFTLRGEDVWDVSGEMDRIYRIFWVGPKFITYLGSSNRSGKSPVAYVVRSESGTLLWAYGFDDGDESASAQTSDTAGLTAISFALPKQISGGVLMEQRLAVIDRSGQMQWEKGGPFWSPTLISLTPDQNGMVVYDGQRTLYRLDAQGRTVAKAFLSDVLKKWSVSSDGSSLLVYTHDGQLSLLHVQ